MPRQTTRTIALGFAGLGVLGALAACAPGTTGGTTDPGTTGGTGGGSTSADGYTDGTYSAEGSYNAPSGTESVTVELTIADDSVTAVTVTGNATDPSAKGFQQQFIDGIADEVVGQKLDELNVTRVSGSSLTSGGFKIAVEAIKAEAAA